MISDTLRRTRAVRVGILSFSAFCVSVRADEPADSLAEVLISGHQLEQSLPQQLGQYGARVDVISNESIRNGGFLDAAQTLQAVAPGLFVQ